MRNLLLLALAGCTCSRSPSIAARDLGALARPGVVTARDGGAAALVGGRMLWLFGDTLMRVTGADGFSYRSCTAAWGALGSLALDEALDATGAPFQLIPYTDEERSYNQANGPTERFALWPGSAIASPAGDGAWIFYQRLKVHPQALNYENLGVGIARLKKDPTIATRDPALLFQAPEPAYDLAAVIDSGMLYLYGCDAVPGALDSVCRIVRAPVGDAATAGAWQVWDGGAWSSDRTRAQPVLHGPPGDLSVSFNGHLNRFLAVYSGMFSNDVVYRTAPRPEGPWSDAQRLFTAMAPPADNDYAAKEHPESSPDNGRTLIVGYARPLGGFDGEVRLASIALP
jgi:hypothetical protein